MRGRLEGTRMLSTTAAVLAALVDLMVVAFAGPQSAVRVLTKPLPAVILAIGAFRATSVANRRLAIGLLLATVGDELLLHDDSTAFLVGMLCFAAMHGFYIACYAALGAFRTALRIPIAIVLVAAVVGVVAIIAPHAGTFAAPLAIYSLLLATMVWFALRLYGNVDVRAGRLIATGALVFMASDTTLAFAKFYPGFPPSGKTAELAIVGSYFLAQILIATGVRGCIPTGPRS